jgi:hypothetical protein
VNRQRVSLGTKPEKVFAGTLPGSLDHPIPAVIGRYLAEKGHQEERLGALQDMLAAPIQTSMVSRSLLPLPPFFPSKAEETGTVPFAPPIPSPLVGTGPTKRGALVVPRQEIVNLHQLRLLLEEGRAALGRLHLQRAEELFARADRVSQLLQSQGRETLHDWDPTPTPSPPASVEPLPVPEPTPTPSPPASVEPLPVPEPSPTPSPPASVEPLPVPEPSPTPSPVASVEPSPLPEPGHVVTAFPPAPPQYSDRNSERTILLTALGILVALVLLLLAGLAILWSRTRHGKEMLPWYFRRL